MSAGIERNYLKNRKVEKSHFNLRDMSLCYFHYDHILNVQSIYSEGFLSIILIYFVNLSSQTDAIK